MATVNKDFKIKSGLVVEGSNATVNGNQVLTENASDQYILNLIGGETLVKSVDQTTFNVDGSGNLTIITNTFDPYGAATTAETNANTYTDNAVFNLASESYVNTAVNNAIDGFNSDLLNYTPTADLDSTVDGYGYLKSADLNGYALETYVDQAETDANTYTDNRETAITTAYQNYADQAETDAKAYADSLIADVSTTTTNTWSAYKINTEIGLAQSAAESYADTAVANLVDGAPALLDTLNELAAALQDNPDVITNIQDVAAGKQDTLTTGNGITIDNNLIYIPTYIGSGISATPGNVEIDRAEVDTWYDAAGAASSAQSAAASDATTKANAAEQNAKDYADGLATNYDPAGSASSAQTAAQNYADGLNTTTNTRIDNLDTDDVAEGSNRYFTDSRARNAVSGMLNGTQTNISVTFDPNTEQLSFVAENGVADSTTSDLAEGSNLYFTDARAISAVSGADISPNTVTIDTYRKEEATQQLVANASTVNVHSLSGMYESAKYLVRVVGWDGGVKHSQITEILMTVDGNKNIAITEYGNVHTSTNPLATFSATDASVIPADFVPTLTATTAVSGCEIIAAATMLSWAD